MSFPFTPSKRPFETNPSEHNGRRKWRKTAPSAPQQGQLKAPPGAVIFRVLCPASKSGNVIGKGGGIVTRIRQETGAKIRLEEVIPGCEERVVVITGSEKDAEVHNEHGKEVDEGTGAADSAEDNKDSKENNEEKEDSCVLEGPKLEKGTSSAQKALLLVFERIVEGEAENDAGDEASKKPTVSVRLVVLSSQVGCLLGKGGSVIKQMLSDSGAQIRILPRDKLPLCASQHDEIVQITGGIDSAREGLRLVTQQLLENAPRDPLPAINPPEQSSHLFASASRPEPLQPRNLAPFQGPHFSNRPYDAVDVAPVFPKFRESVAPGKIPIPPEQLTFRLLCSNDKVGSVIGKGGSIVKTLQHETGCDIKILETTPESDDRVIIISGPAHPDDRISPAQDGVLRVQHRIVLALPDNKESVILSRLLVSSTQTGCLLGKGGAIIAEMRKMSGAHIRILNKDQIPKSVTEHDEVVQVTGEFTAVQEALLQITARLKSHLFRDKFPAMNHVGHPTFADQMPPFGSYMGRGEPSPPRFFSNLPPFQKDAVGHRHEERSAFGYGIHSSGVPPHSVERMPPAPWAPQGMRDGVGSMPLPDYAGGAPHRRLGPFAGGNQPAIITNTTVDVVVPRALVPIIYGEDGGCLRRIREISEAKITITEPRPEATETVIIISGTPEQTHAAQSLLQAFVLSETGNITLWYPYFNLGLHSSQAQGNTNSGQCADALRARLAPLNAKRKSRKLRKSTMEASQQLEHMQGLDMASERMEMSCCEEKRASLLFQPQLAVALPDRISEQICYCAVQMANNLRADAIFVYTKHGHMASLLSCSCPNPPIFAFRGCSATRRWENKSGSQECRAEFLIFGYLFGGK